MIEAFVTEVWIPEGFGLGFARGIAVGDGRRIVWADDAATMTALMARVCLADEGVYAQVTPRQLLAAAAASSLAPHPLDTASPIDTGRRAVASG